MVNIRQRERLHGVYMRSRSHHEPLAFGALTPATPAYDRPVSTLDDRIKEVCAAREVNEAQWLSQAGLSHALFSSFRVRLGKDPKASISHDKLEVLARAARVQLRWLKRGEGPRDVEGATPYDVRSHLAAAQPSAHGVAEAPGTYGQRGFTLNIRVEDGKVPELRFGSLVEWPALLASARAARPQVGDEVWRAVAETRLFLPAPPTAEMIGYVADVVARMSS